MDFNTDCSSFKSTFIEEKNDNNENIFSNSYHCIALKKNSSTFLISKESELNSTTQEGSISLRMETKPKIIETCSNSYIINQEDFTYQKSESPDSFENFNALLEYEQTECLLKQRLSSIAELKESDSYHDYHKFAKDKLIEEKIVYEETSKEIISEKNSIESSSLKKISASSRKSQSKKLMFENKINHSTPILTSETQIEIYKILNLDQGASGMNILQELENRKNMQNRSVTLSANSEKKNRNEINQRKRVTTDDTYSDKNKIKKLNCKSYKTFQNVNYSSKLTSILKEDPLKKIEQEYEEDKNNTDKIMSDSYVLSILRSNPEKINSQPQIRMKNIACMKDLSSSSKCLFTCVLSTDVYIAVGSDKGLIVIEHKKSGGAFIILGNSSELKNKGHVICLDIGYHNKMLVAGYSSGILAFFNLKKGKLAKKIEGIFKNKRIKIVKFLKSHDPKKKDFTIVAMDEDGILMRIFIQKTNNFGRKILKKQCSMIIYDKFKGNLLQIEPLFIDFEDNKQKKNCFVACATTSRCYILNLENNICQFEIEKPSYINNKAIPMLSVDQTDFQNENALIKCRCLIAFGNLLVIISFMKSETKEEYFWKITKNLLINSDIIYTTIISSQIILGIDESEQRIFLFHFDEMNEGDLQKINLKIFKDINHYKIRSQDKEINQLMSHFKKKSLDFSERFLVTSDFFHSTIYFLIDSQLFFFNLISWEKHLNYFLAEEDYVNAMINMIQIFKNQIKYLANIPPNSKKRKEILSNSIKEITIDYFLQSTKKIQDIIMDSSYVKEIAITIEFLVETEHFDFLFNNIMKDLELKGFLKQFILSLEPFILKKKIRMVPEASLMKVIECLLKENKRNVADKLMMNLNFKQFNYQFFIAVCLENCLFKGLIHLYFEENDNFMYPIIKILNSILHNSSNSKLNYEDVQDLKYRCLWYIQICIKGHLITGEFMPLEKWKIAIRQLTEWIINQENFVILLKLDTDIAFKLLFLLFKGYPYQIIKMSLDFFDFKEICKTDCSENIFYINPSKIKNINILLNLENSLIEQNIKLKKDNNKITSDPLSFIIEFIIYNENLYAIENPFYAEHKRFAFFIFLIQIYHQAGEYIINPKMGFMCVQYFMEKPEKLDLYQIYECDIFRYMRKDELEIKKSECLIQILRLLHDRIETKDYFEKLITVDSTLSGIKLYLLMIKKNYQACIELFIKTKNPIFKNNIFDWLSNLISKLERCDEESVTLITKNILNKSAELVSVNCYRAYNLFKKYIPNEEKNIIFSLQNHPKLGIEYFQHYIKSHRKEENFHLETDLGTIYAELLIKENKFEKFNEEIKRKIIGLEIAKEMLMKHKITEKVSVSQILQNPSKNN